MFSTLQEEKIYRCLICYNEYNDKTEIISPCQQTPNSYCCLQCFIQYLRSKFENTYEGACPILTCVFCESTSERKCLISDHQLNQYCPDLYTRYIALSSSLLSIQCSNCHTRKSVFLLQPNDTTEAVSNLESRIRDFPQFMVVLKAYDQGHISIRNFFDQLTTIYCTNLLSTGSDVLAWNLMKYILLLLQNSERRANLHLRYINFRPCVWSPCCNTAMCFKCKTKNYHEGQTCEDVTSKLSNDLLSCSQCGVTLVKGDGCDTIVCVCGYRFSWSEELQRVQLSSEFSSFFPVNTAFHCAEILCDPDRYTESIRRATGWSKIHKEQFEQALLGWYMLRFGIAAAQLCIPIMSLKSTDHREKVSCCRLPKGLQNATTERATTLWMSAHMNEVRECEHSVFLARHSLLYTYYPHSEDRALLLSHMVMFEQMKAQKVQRWKLFSADFEPLDYDFSLPSNEAMLRGLDLVEKASLLQEAQQWYQSPENRVKVHDKLVKLWIQRVNQFLCCFGDRKVQLIPSESRDYDYDILYSTCYDSSSLSLRTLEKNDRVKLRNAIENSTVLNVYSDGLVALRHDCGGNGLYKRERIIALASQTYLPFPGISSPHLENFVCYLLYLQALLKPETLFINTASELIPLPPKTYDHHIRSTFIDIIENLDFMTLSKLNLDSYSITWIDLVCIMIEEGISRSV